MLSARKSSTVKLIINSMKESLQNVKVESYLNLDDKPTEVRLINVLQYFWINEKELSRESKTCWQNCDFYKTVSFNDDGCIGTIRDCERKLQKGYAAISNVAEHQRVDINFPYILVTVQQLISY